MPLHFSVCCVLSGPQPWHCSVLEEWRPENIVGLVQNVALASIASSCFLIVTLNHLQKNQGWQRGHKGDLFPDPEWYFILFSGNFDNINKAKHRTRRERSKKNPSDFGRLSSDLTANELSGILGSNHEYTITLDETTSYKTGSDLWQSLRGHSETCQVCWSSHKTPSSGRGMMFAQNARQRAQWGQEWTTEVTGWWLPKMSLLNAYYSLWPSFFFLKHTFSFPSFLWLWHMGRPVTKGAPSEDSSEWWWLSLCWQKRL